MGRLIDTDDLKKLFEGKEGDTFTAFHFFEAIDNTPTAYDVEAKVAELENLKVIADECCNITCAECKYKGSCLEGEEFYKVALDRAVALARR